MTRVALLQLGHVPRPSQSLEGDYPELFSALLGPHGTQVTAFDCDHGETPASIDDFGGWLVSPGRASTYDDLPWLAGVEDLIRAIVAAGRPLVAVCFGHQLTAKALGGRVERSERGWGLGPHTYEIDPATAPAPVSATTITLVASHQDQVTVAPDGTQVWAGNEHCPIGGLVVGDRAWTIQTHPELSATVASHILEIRMEALGEDVVRSAQASLETTPLDRTNVATWIAATLTSHGRPI